MRAILILGVLIMPWLDDMKAMSAAIPQPVVSKEEAARRRFYQQQIPVAPPQRSGTNSNGRQINLRVGRMTA